MLFQSQYYIYTFIVFKCYDYQEEKKIIIKSKRPNRLRRNNILWENTGGGLSVGDSVFSCEIYSSEC